MSPVWRPAVDPPKLDEFCHLSHDAQLVMAAFYSDYHQRKQQLFQTPVAVSDPKNYYQSIYEARFGKANIEVSSSNNQNEHISPHENNANNVYRQYESTNADGGARNARLSSNSKQPPVYTARKLDFNNNRPNLNGKDPSNHKVSNSVLNMYAASSGTTDQLSQDTSRYSDSPPIETQDYRFLSQYQTDTESINDTYDVDDSDLASYPTADAPKSKSNTKTTLNEFNLNTRLSKCHDYLNEYTDNPNIFTTAANKGYDRIVDNKFEEFNYHELQGTAMADVIPTANHTITAPDNNRITEVTESGSHNAYVNMCAEFDDNHEQKGSSGIDFSDSSDKNLDASQCLFSQDTNAGSKVVKKQSVRNKKITKHCSKLQAQYERSNEKPMINKIVENRYNDKKLGNCNKKTTSFQKNNVDEKQLQVDNDNLIAEQANKFDDFNENPTEVFSPERAVFSLGIEMTDSRRETTFEFNPINVSLIPTNIAKESAHCAESKINNKTNTSNFNKHVDKKMTSSNMDLFHKLDNMGMDEENPLFHPKNKNQDLKQNLHDNGRSISTNHRDKDFLTKRCSSKHSDKKVQRENNIRHDDIRESSNESPFVETEKKLPVYPMFDRTNVRDAENVALQVPREYGNSKSVTKRTSNSKGFAIPFKKQRIQENHHHKQNEISTGCTMVDLSCLCDADLDTVVTDLLTVEEVVVVVVYNDGSTQLRDNMFGQDTKKRAGGKLRQMDSVGGFAVGTKHRRDVYLFPKEPKSEHRLVKLREFWNHLLMNNSRKIGLNVKALYGHLMTAYKFDFNKVNVSWTVLDVTVALWLLDPDKPVTTLEQVLLTLQLPEQAACDTSISALHGDMQLLTVAMARIYQRLESRHLWQLFLCVETRLTSLLAAMELRTIHIATHTLLQFSEILKKKNLKLEKQAHLAAGHPFLLSSHPQLRQVLFEELRLDTKLPCKTKLAKTSVGRETSTSETVLTQLSPFHTLPGLVLEYRQLQKLKSTYIDGILSCVHDGMLSTHWDQTAAATGRLTSYQPNIQAIPKVPVVITGYKDNYIAGRDKTSEIEINARDPFVSRDGWSLLAADFQQIELRLLGHLANDPVLLQIFNDPDIPDIFNALTSQWLGKSVESVTSTEREQTKRVVYSVMYGAGKEKLGEYLKISADNAKAIMTSFLLKFPAVSQFTKCCVEYCQKYGYTTSIFRRRRLFPNIKHRSHPLRAQAERQCVNFCVQGSAADLCKAAMLQVESVLAETPQLKARLLVQIHDELLLEVADEDMKQVAALVKEVMESQEKLCGSMVKLNVPIPVSLSVGKSWGSMVDFTH